MLFKTLTSNYVLNIGVVSWFLAQLLKTIFTLIGTKKLVLERLIGSGGMPSSHSALVTSVAIGVARVSGFSSPEFGLAFAFAAVVMYDAMGVRRAAGEQAKVLNKIIFEFSFPFFGQEKTKARVETTKEDTAPPSQNISDKPDAIGEQPPILEKQLKEFLGHTPFEVLGGCLLGILVAILMPVP